MLRKFTRTQTRMPSIMRDVGVRYKGQVRMAYWDGSAWQVYADPPFIASVYAVEAEKIKSWRYLDHQDKIDFGLLVQA